jgi:hypothetical protein
MPTTSSKFMSPGSLRTLRVRVASSASNRMLALSFSLRDIRNMRVIGCFGERWANVV